MADAKNRKLQEYGTDILSHSSQGQDDGPRVRANNTFKSSVMDSTPDLALNKAKSRDRIFQQRPLTAQVTRTSYQDSNIFGYKDQGSETVQQAAQNDPKQERIRCNPTYQSRVFSPVGEDAGDERPNSKTRVEYNWRSTVFDGPITEESRRKKIGREDAGTENLFGSHTVDYENKSNKINVLSQKKPQKKWEPVRKTAEQRKNDELYGRSAAIYGTGKKGDGSLMANSADWRNLQQTHTNQFSKNQQKNGNIDDGAKDRKYQNLQSNILCNEDDTSKPTYNKDLEKAAFGSSSDWTVQGGSAKVINKGRKVDTFQKKKNQLASTVFDLPDYQEHVPMKKKVLDVNNITDNKRRQDHMYSDIMGQSGLDYKTVKSPVKKTDDDQSQRSQTQKQPKNSKGAKQNNLRSSLDNHNYEAELVRIPEDSNENQDQVDYKIPGKKDRVTKVKELSSNILGNDTASKFAQSNNETTVVDLDLKGLPANIEIEDLKKISGVKHVINATVDQDSIRNVCTGTGRIKLRLSANEDLDSVKLKYVQAGFSVLDHKEDPKKKCAFTIEATLTAKSPVRGDDAKTSKMSNLQSNNPEIFGNSAQYQKKHNLNFDPNEVNNVKTANVSESLAIDNWGKVGGKR